MLSLNKPLLLLWEDCACFPDNHCVNNSESFSLFSDYKRLSELDLNTKDEVGKLLLSRNTWREVAFKLNISSDEIDAQRDTGRDVMEFLEATKPDLKVYDLCKMLKNLKIQRFDIANLLLDHLSAPVTKRSQTP